MVEARKGLWLMLSWCKRKCFSGKSQAQTEPDRHREEWRWSRFRVNSNQTWVQQLVHSTLPCVFPISGTVPGAMPRFTVTSWKWKSCKKKKKSVLSVINIHPIALQGIQSSLQSRSGGGLCFSTQQKLKGGKFPMRTQKWKIWAGQSHCYSSPHCKFPALSECREKAVAIETSGGKCTLYHVLYTFSRRSFNLSLPPCNFTETIMLIKPLNVTVTSNQIK